MALPSSFAKVDWKIFFGAIFLTCFFTELCLGQTPSPAPGGTETPSVSSPSITSAAGTSDKTKGAVPPDELYQAAKKEMQKKNYDGALAQVDAAEKLYPTDSSLENLRGAIYTEQRNFAKAIEAFTKASELNKKSFNARFNLCEVFFLAKMYPEALAHFEALGAEYPKNELVLYNIFLCDLVQDKPEAKKILNGLTFGDDYPTYYYAHAAWEFKNGNTKEARGWITSANNIYSRQMNLIYSDSLVELGWLPREGPQTQFIPPNTGN